MRFNTNSGIGILLTIIGLTIIAGVIERCPLKASAPNNSCNQKIIVEMIPEKETYKTGEEITLINKSAAGWKWSLGGSDSITDGGINDQFVKFIYRENGEKTIRLINRYKRCRKVIQTISVTSEKKKKIAPPPKDCPKARIKKIRGELKCEEYVWFDAGTNENADLEWSFDQFKTKLPGGKIKRHKFMDETTYTVRVYCKGREIGRRNVYITCF